MATNITGTHQARSWYASGAILTHEATEIPFEQTIADLLTQFFESVGARLHTSILVGEVEDVESVVGAKRDAEGSQRARLAFDRLTLVKHRGYVKEDVTSTE